MLLDVLDLLQDNINGRFRSWEVLGILNAWRPVSYSSRALLTSLGPFFTIPSSGLFSLELAGLRKIKRLKFFKWEVNDL